MEKKYNKSLCLATFFLFAYSFFFSGKIYSAAAAYPKKEKQEALNEQLFVGAKALDYETVNSALFFKANINARNKNGSTPLIIVSMECDNTLILDLLLRNNADPRMANHQGLTPFMAILTCGPELGIYKLLAAGSSLSAKDVFGDTFSYFADTPEAKGVVANYTQRSCEVIKKEESAAFVQEVGNPSKLFVQKGLVNILASLWLKKPTFDDIERRQDQLAELQVKKKHS